jgi:hypothetical protein
VKEVSKSGKNIKGSEINRGRTRQAKRIYLIGEYKTWLSE